MKHSLWRLGKASTKLDFLKTTPLTPGKAKGTAKYQATAVPISTDLALEQLERIVNSAKSSKVARTKPASLLFQQNEELYSVPKANGLLVRDYIKWQDFSTAHAYILQRIDNIQAGDVAFFITKSFLVSENSKHIISVFEAAMACGSFSREEKATIAANTLLGLKWLQESVLFDKVSRWCYSQGLSRQIPLQQVQLYTHYVNRRFDEALELSRTIKAKAEGYADYLLMFPYRCAVLHASRNGELETVLTIAAHMEEIDLDFPLNLSNTALTYLPLMYADTAPIEWFRLWQDKKWKLSRVSFLIMVDHLAQQFPAIGSRIWKKSDQLLESTPSSRRLPVPQLQSRHSTFFREFRSSLYDQKDLNKSLQLLDTQRRRGIMPSYDYYVHLFEALVKHRKDSELESVKTQMAKINYPLHCAGIDMAVLERQLNDLPHTEGRQQMCRLLLDDYLRQYPLNVHDIVYLTRIASIYWHYLGDPESAEHALEFKRLCSPSAKFSSSNHDCNSLTLLLRFNKEKVDEWVFQLLSDEPNIIFDQNFKRVLSKALKNNNMESLRKPILEKIRKHNDRLLNSVLSQIEHLYDNISIESFSESDA